VKRNFGSLTGLLAILAIALHTAFPTAQESGGGATSAVTGKKSDAKNDSNGKDADRDYPRKARGSQRRLISGTSHRKGVLSISTICSPWQSRLDGKRRGN